jgi:hypothetical protein
MGSNEVAVRPAAKQDHPVLAAARTNRSAMRCHLHLPKTMVHPRLIKFFDTVLVYHYEGRVVGCSIGPLSSSFVI